MEISEHFDSYKRYFLSGFYKKRYPKPNKRTLEIIRKGIPFSERILDVGCGEGRYSIPLSEKFDVTAVDVSEEAVYELKEFKSVNSKTNIDITIEALPLRLKSKKYEKKFRKVIMIFGVLSHIVHKKERAQLLKDIQEICKRNKCEFVVSVPNEARRFRNISKDEEGVITYSRHHNNDRLTFYYKLYTLENLRIELFDAGFREVKVSAESVLPESLVVRYKMLGLVDQFLCLIIPDKYGYVLLAVASC